MNHRIVLVTVLAISLLLSATCSRAGSIWAKRDKNMKDLYADDVARQIGDVLTIKVAEDSKVDNKAKRDLMKETDKSATFDGRLGIDHILPIQTIEVSGIVRPSDIAFDNTVKSEQVADFRIVTKNAGIAAPYTRPGWLGRIFDIVWPF